MVIRELLHTTRSTQVQGSRNQYYDQILTVTVTKSLGVFVRLVLLFPIGLRKFSRTIEGGSHGSGLPGVSGRGIRKKAKRGEGWTEIQQ